MIIAPSMERLRLIAGSTVWKKRRCSQMPPRMRTHFSPFSQLEILDCDVEPELAEIALVRSIRSRVGVGDAKNAVAP